MKELRANTAAILKYGPMVDATNGVDLEAGLATAMNHATTGIRLTKNGGNIAARGTLTLPTYDEIGYYNVSLSTADIDEEGILRVAFNDAACVPHWQDYMVLNESAYDAKYLPHPTMQAGSTASTAKLASGAVAKTGDLNGKLVRPISGTGAGQAARVITSSTITTDVCAIVPDWNTTPDATTKYEIIEVQQGVIEVDGSNQVVAASVTAEVDANMVRIAGQTDLVVGGSDPATPVGNT